jgi:amino acid adenylation domain-containing protein
MERSLELIIALLAILKSGGAYAALDANIPLKRVLSILEDACPAGIVVSAEIENAVTDSIKTGYVSITSIPFVFNVNQWTQLNSGEATDNLDSKPNCEDQAYVCYTSGSSGRPKGVSIPHRAVVRLVKNANYVSLSASDVFVQLAPISFDASTFEIWGCLLNGGRLIVLPSANLSLTQIGSAIRKRGVSVLWLTAALFNQMVDYELDSLESVGQILTGGDVLSITHVRKALERLGEGRLINGYGPTENTTFTCCFPISNSSVEGHSIPIGRPISNTQCYILDRNLQPVPIGVRGELFAGGDGLALGYLNDAKLTAEKFLGNCLRPGSLYYRTGDFARYRADGSIEFLGRIDHQVKIRGYRIELGEIETTLNLHPSVREAVVVAREDAPGDRRLVAYVAPASASAAAGELREYLKARLPAYMLPSAFVFVDTFPLTQNGKLDRKALPMPEARSANTAGSSDPTETVMTSVERRISDIWRKILALERVGLRENFFELGGHSLLLLKLHGELQREFSSEFAVVKLFQHPTIATQAELFAPGASSVNTLQPIPNHAVKRAQERAARRTNG